MHLAFTHATNFLGINFNPSVFVFNLYFVKSIQALKLGEAGWWTDGGGVMKWAVNNDKYGVQYYNTTHTTTDWLLKYGREQFYIWDSINIISTPH